MTIDEAIRVLDDYNPEEEYTNYHKVWQALKLGISALKWIRKNRGYGVGHVVKQLPGETRRTPTQEQAKAARGDTE